MPEQENSPLELTQIQAGQIEWYSQPVGLNQSYETVNGKKDKIYLNKFELPQSEANLHKSVIKKMVVKLIQEQNSAEMLEETKLPNNALETGRGDGEEPEILE